MAGDWVEPEPFIWELDLAGDQWTLRDVTDLIAAEGEAQRADAAQAKARLIEQAGVQVAQLVEERAAEGRLLTKGEVEQFLTRIAGLTRDDARRIITDGGGRRWRIEPISGQGNPQAFLPVNPEKWPAKITAQLKKHEGSRRCGDRVSAGPGNSRSAKSLPHQPSDSANDSPDDPVAAARTLFPGARVVERA